MVGWEKQYGYAYSISRFTSRTVGDGLFRLLLSAEIGMIQIVTYDVELIKVSDCGQYIESKLVLIDARLFLHLNLSPSKKVRTPMYTLQDGNTNPTTSRKDPYFGVSSNHSSELESSMQTVCCGELA